MHIFVFIVFTLLGIGRNLPYQSIYFFGLGLGDLLFCALTLVLLLRSESRKCLFAMVGTLKVPIQAMLVLAACATASLSFNSFVFGVEARDLFEILKYLYLLVVMVVTGQCTQSRRIAPIVGFVFGVLISGLVALMNPMNPDVLGTPQIFNPNVIGNVLAVSIVFCSFLILAGFPLVGSGLAFAAFIIALFTFSKGTWLMSLLGLGACVMALISSSAVKAKAAMRWGRYGAVVLLGVLIYMANFYGDVIFLVIEAKINATEFGATAAEGGSFSARAGLMLSAFRMFLMNPLFGVGISNFEHVNHLLEGELGGFYYDDDNPNSAWFYVLGCMGLFSFIMFSLVFYWFLRSLRNAPISNAKIGLLYMLCVGLVFFIGGNVQLEMLTAYYYWVALGVVAAWRSTAINRMMVARIRY